MFFLWHSRADLARFGDPRLVTIDDFGGWKKAQAKYFADGGVFAKIYTPAQQGL